MTPGRAEPSRRRRQTGARAYARGHAAEAFAALWLLAKGWRLVAFRARVQGVEIDIAAVRGGVLAVVEVKRRARIEDALAAVSPAQLARLRRAGEALAAVRARAGRPTPSVRLDLLALAPRRLPRHVPDAWAHGPLP